MLFLTSLALASYDYPAFLATELAMPCAPTCTVCHASNAGGSGTVTQDFGVALMANGAGGSDIASVSSALAALASTDSDGDGLFDPEALALGLDPNTGEELCGATVTPPHYGCGKGSDAWILVGLVGLGVRRRAMSS